MITAGLHITAETNFQKENYTYICIALNNLAKILSDVSEVLNIITYIRHSLNLHTSFISHLTFFLT